MFVEDGRLGGGGGGCGGQELKSNEDVQEYLIILHSIK
jgi:hypothetical protein